MSGYFFAAHRAQRLQGFYFKINHLAVANEPTDNH
jgi:hypothetical protein